MSQTDDTLERELREIAEKGTYDGLPEVTVARESLFHCEQCVDVVKRQVLLAVEEAFHLGEKRAAANIREEVARSISELEHVAAQDIDKSEPILHAEALQICMELEAQALREMLNGEPSRRGGPIDVDAILREFKLEEGGNG